MKYILEFKDIHKEDVVFAGEKGIEVANIVHAGCSVGEGFVVSSQAFADFFEGNNLWEKIARLLEIFDIRSGQNSLIVSERIRDFVEKGPFPEQIKKEIIDRYEEIGGLLSGVKVNICSSYEGYSVSLERVKGEANLLSGIRSLWASFFSSDRLLFYLEAGRKIGNVRASVVVQKELVQSVKGIGFTKVGKEVGQDFVLTEVKDEKHAQEFSKDHRDEILAVLRLIDKHYFFPQQVDWVWSKGEFFVLRVRPSSYSFRRVESGRTSAVQTILAGQGSGFGVATGVVRVITDAKQLIRVKRGEVVVTKEVTRDYFSVFGRVSALIAEGGESTGYSSIISRELKLPMVTGVSQATEKLSDGMVVTVFGGSGEVYWGDGMSMHPKEQEVNRKSETRDTATKIYASFSTKTTFKAGDSIDGVYPLIGKGVGVMGVEGRILQLCENIYPKNVVYQFSASNLLALRGEMDVVKRVRARFSNLWVSLPSGDSTEFLEAKRVLAGSLGLLRNEDFKIFLSIRTPSAFFYLTDIIDFGVDGVIVDLKQLYKHFSGSRDEVKIEQYQNDLAFWRLIKNLVKKCLDTPLPVIVYERNIYLYHEFVHKLVALGFSGISTRILGVEKLRSVVYEAEKELVGGSRTLEY